MYSNELWRALLITLFPVPSFVFIWQRFSVCLCVCVFAFLVCFCWPFDQSCRTETNTLYFPKVHLFECSSLQSHVQAIAASPSLPSYALDLWMGPSVDLVILSCLFLWFCSYIIERIHKSQRTLENICEHIVCALTRQYEKVRSFHLSKWTAATWILTVAQGCGSTVCPSSTCGLVSVLLEEWLHLHHLTVMWDACGARL